LLRPLRTRENRVELERRKNEWLRQTFLNNK